MSKQRQVIRLALLLVATAFISMIAINCRSATEAYHKYIMKGSVIDKTAQGVYICVGTHDGARVGQVLDVYRYERQQLIGANRILHRKESVGSVRIKEITGVHMAVAEVVSGNVKVGDTVEMLPCCHGEKHEH